ncbi:hypothetical protein ACFLQW_00960 [Candidatus Zixiibacteriota bacterium]
MTLEDKGFGGDLLLLVVSLSLSAMLMAIAISSPDHGWMAWICLLPLFLAIQILSPLGAGIAGAFWGLCFYIFAVIVIGGTISPSLKSLLLLTGAPAIYASGGAYLTRRLGFRPFLLALGWIGVELALIPLGLGAGLLAGTQGDSVHYHWIGRIFGYVFLAFLIAGANVLLLDILCEARLQIPCRILCVTPRESGINHKSSFYLRLRQLADSRARPRAPPGPQILSYQT